MKNTYAPGAASGIIFQTYCYSIILSESRLSWVGKAGGEGF